MRSTFTFIAAIAVLLCVCLPASAVTIQPGVYTLEWRVPKPDADVGFASRAWINFSPLSPQEAVWTVGLVSARPYCGRTDRFRVILDESAGTGSGWDTAYVTRVGEPRNRNAIKLSLKRRDNTLESSSPSGALIELDLGSADAHVTRKAALGLEVYLEADAEGEPRPAFGLLALRGGWYGKVVTDSGELAVQSVDLNRNYCYGDLSTISTTSKLPEIGDAIVFGGASADFDGYDNVVRLGSAIAYDGKLYQCSVSPTGERLEIKAYGGETGVLSFDPRDGYGRQAGCRKVIVYAHAGVFSSTDGGELTVPPGDYRCLTALVLPADSEAAGDIFGAFVQRSDPVTLAAGEKTAMRLGGAVDVVVDQESDTIEMNAGETRTIKMLLKAGDDDLVGLDGGCKVWVNIRDSKGTLLSSEKAEIGPNGTCEYRVSIPEDWKSGTYTLGVAFESPSYQKPSYAHKTLRVGR